MRLKLIAPIIAGIVIIGLLLFGISQCEKKNEYRDQAFSAESGARKVEASANARIAHRDSLDLTKAKKMQKDSLDNLRVQDSLKMASRKALKKYTDLKAKIKPISDEIPAVAEFVLASDSLYQAKEAELLECQRVSMVREKDYIERLALSMQNRIDESKKAEAWRVAADQAERKSAKQEKRKKFFRTTTLILAGALGIFAVSQ